MEDHQLRRVTIPGAALASLLQRCFSAPSDSDGLLFGRVSLFTSSSLSDDHSSSSPALVVTVTDFFSSGSTASFYDFAGRPHLSSLRSFLHLNPSLHLLGWFSARRRSALLPSLREFSVSRNLSSESQLSFPVGGDSSSTFFPSIFLLLATPCTEQQTLIHTYDYRAYQFHVSSNTLDAKSLDVINIGPAFRGHYTSFCPNSGFPYLPCHFRGSPMKEEDEDMDSFNNLKRFSKDHSQLNLYVEGHGVGSLSKLLGSEALDYASGLEDLYNYMLTKLDSLARDVERSSSKVLEQESFNVSLRCKVAGIGVSNDKLA